MTWPGATRAQRNAAKVYAALEAHRDSATAFLVTLGERSAVRVKMDQESWNVKLFNAGGGDGLSTGRMTGTVSFVLREVL